MLNGHIHDYTEFLTAEKTRFSQVFGKPSEVKSQPEDFDYHFVVGSGSFGTVALATRKTDKDKYLAIKIISKQNVVNLQQVPNILNEKQILEAVKFPFLLEMDSYYMDNSYVYFVLPFMHGGDLFALLILTGSFTEAHSKFYSSQICLALEYLHLMDIIHRDLKPENILLDSNGYVKLADFGFCKVVKGRTGSMCGTPDYLAPEILSNNGYGKSVDWWAFGVLIYELNYGYPPFNDRDEMKRCERITNARYRIPMTFSPQLAHLISHLIVIDLSQRYGNLAGGTKDIKNHPWFKEIHWLGIINRSVKPPYTPSDYNLNTKFTKKFNRNVLQISPIDSYKVHFQNF